MQATFDYQQIERPSFLTDLPPFPPVALRAMQVLSDEDSDSRKVIEVIAADPAFSSELLRSANSPAYGLAMEVRTLNHAISVVGRERLRSLTMTMALKSFLKAPFRGTLFQDSWKHSIATALLASGLADICRLKKEVAYTAGLLHDVGRAALLVSRRKEYSAMIRTENLASDELLHNEQRKFRINHCQIGRLLIQDWGLPPDIAIAAAHHHDEPPHVIADTKDVVMLACRLASSLGFHAHKRNGMWTTEQVAAKLPRSYHGPTILNGEILKEAIAKKLSAVC
jgi:putative nucleotidyltransferase with HDIG domain